MSKENEILDYIARDDQISQRDLAGKTGLSLGNVNLLIKKMVKKGLIKIERLKPNSLRYILTPKGLAEKSRKTYNYIVHSVQYILKVKAVMQDILHTYIQQKHYAVYLYGEQDEVCEMIRQIVDESGYKEITYIDHLTEEILQAPNTVVLLWDPRYEEHLNNKGVEYINILCMI